MRALVCHKITDDFSGTEVRDVPMPEPGPGEVRVRVKAASVNFPDLLLTQGKYQLKLEPPFTPGMDFSGIIDKLGPGVTGPLREGTDVAGGMRAGAFAEFICVPVEGLQKKPPAMSFRQAARRDRDCDGRLG